MGPISRLEGNPGMSSDIGFRKYLIRISDSGLIPGSDTSTDQIDFFFVQEICDVGIF